MSKRSLAGVAAGALALGMLSIASAPAASAGKSIKPKATLNNTSAVVGPVRYSTTATVRDVVFGAPMGLSIIDDTTVNTSADDTIVITLTTAPSTSAALWLSRTQDDTVGPSFADDTLTLVSPTSGVDDTLGKTTSWFQTSFNADDSNIYTWVGVSEGGSYGGTIQIFDGATAGTSSVNRIINATFSFTTRGAPTSFTVAPTSVSLNASIDDTKAVSVTPVDSAGNATQIGYLDSLTFAASPAGIVTTLPTTGVLTPLSFDDTTQSTLGNATLRVTGTTTAGTTTVTGVPAGTIGTLPRPSFTVTSIGAGSVAPTSMVLSAPTTQVIDETVSDDTLGYFLNANLVRSFTVTASGLTPNSPYALTVTPTVNGSNSFTGLGIAGTTMGSSATTVFATADASGVATYTASWTSSTGTPSLMFYAPASTGRNAKFVQVQLVTSGDDASASPSGLLVKQTGAATTFDVSLVDDFGNPFIGYGVVAYTKSTTSSAQGAVSARGVTNASGETTIEVAAPSATFAGAASVIFLVTNPGGVTDSGLTGDLNGVTTITYTASGDITSMTVTPGATGTNALTTVSPTPLVIPQISIPSTATGRVGTTQTSRNYTIATATASTGAVTPVAQFRVSTTPGNATVVTAPDGVSVSDTAPTSMTLWNGGEASATIANDDSVYVWATKTGVHDITFTSGTQSIVAKVRVVNGPQDAYNIAVTPETQDLQTNGFGSVTVKVTDVFGNPVTTVDDTGMVTVTASGTVLLAGQSASSNITTGAAGDAKVTVLTFAEVGEGLLTVVPKSSNKATAWGATYVKPASFPAPVVSAVAKVIVSSRAEKSITIVGSRTTVKGKPGIQIDGVTSGIEDGKTVIPYFRFPGQTSYSQGSARPVITDSTFEWLRKTGKKFYAYVTNDDGAVQSNRVIIPAK